MFLFFSLIKCWQRNAQRTWENMRKEGMVKKENEQTSCAFEDWSCFGSSQLKRKSKRKEYERDRKR